MMDVQFIEIGSEPVELQSSLSVRGQRFSWFIVQGMANASLSREEHYRQWHMVRLLPGAVVMSVLARDHKAHTVIIYSRARQKL